MSEVADGLRTVKCEFDSNAQKECQGQISNVFDNNYKDNHSNSNNGDNVNNDHNSDRYIKSLFQCHFLVFLVFFFVLFAVAKKTSPIVLAVSNRQLHSSLKLKCCHKSGDLTSICSSHGRWQVIDVTLVFQQEKDKRRMIE